MKVKLINPEQYVAYEKYVETHPLGSIHQSISWGKMQDQQENREFYKIIAIVNDDEHILASVLLIKHKLPFKKCFLYSHRGPLFNINNSESIDALKLLLKEIATLSKKENAIFLRVDPPLIKTKDNELIFKDLSFKVAHAEYQPEHTLVLDLKKSLDDLLKEMKPKGRYNIKVAKKHGVEIKKSNLEPKETNSFYQVLRKTARRDKFSVHSENFYQQFLEILNKEKKADLYIATLNNKVIGGIIVTYYGETATYYFGASDIEYRSSMAPYLLQWQAITDAKKQGYKYYDFFGIAPENKPNHPWQGVTAFKKKFGGKEIDYIGASEYVYQPFWYKVMLLVKKLRGTI